MGFRFQELEQRARAVGLSAVKPANMDGVPREYMREIVAGDGNAPMCCLCHHDAYEVTCEQGSLISPRQKIGYFCGFCGFGYLFKVTNAERTRIGLKPLPSRFDQILKLLEAHAKSLGQKFEIPAPKFGESAGYRRPPTRQ